MSLIVYKIFASLMLTGTSLYFLSRKYENDAKQQARYKIITTPPVRDGDFPKKWKGPA